MLPRKTARGEEALARLSVRDIPHDHSRAGQENRTIVDMIGAP